MVSRLYCRGTCRRAGALVTSLASPSMRATQARLRALGSSDSLEESSYNERRPAKFAGYGSGMAVVQLARPGTLTQSQGLVRRHRRLSRIYDTILLLSSGASPDLSPFSRLRTSLALVATGVLAACLLFSTGRRRCSAELGALLAGLFMGWFLSTLMGAKLERY
eukprot:6197663-Pleurochrysis_carterae.AAC.4